MIAHAEFEYNEPRPTGYETVTLYHKPLVFDFRINLRDIPEHKFLEVVNSVATHLESIGIPCVKGLGVSR